jgi:hypothetical protein
MKGAVEAGRPNTSCDEICEGWRRGTSEKEVNYFAHVEVNQKRNN